MFSPPPIDSTTQQDLIKKMKEMVPFYAPEWRFTPDEPERDPGTALFYLFSEMLLGNIQRLNQVPNKNFLSYLNMLGTQTLDATAATSFVTFALSQGKRDTVLVPAGTQLVAAPPKGQEVVFETQQDLQITPATLLATYCVSPKQDQVLKVSDGATLFEFTADASKQHLLYLGHADLFDITHPSTIELSLFTTGQTPIPEGYGQLLATAVWEYYTAKGWQAFDMVTGSGNQVTLTKQQTDAVVPLKVAGTASRWLRCSLKAGEISPTCTELTIGCIKATADALPTSSLVPDLLFYNDTALEPKQCDPFGEFFTSFGIFYLSSREVFSKRGGTVTMTFDIAFVEKQQSQDQQQIEWKLIMRQSAVDKPPPLQASIQNVDWEYWNGKNWSPLQVNGGGQLFTPPVIETDDSESSQPTPTPTEKTVTFVVPSDIAMKTVNGNQTYWVRARVSDVKNLYTRNPIFQTPTLSGISLSYQYADLSSARDIQLCVTSNYGNVVSQLSVLQGQTYSLQTESYSIPDPQSFQPFQGLQGQSPTLYLGFDQPLQNTTNLYISLKPQKRTAAPPVVKWQYAKKNGDWADLKGLSDGTTGLTSNGQVTFDGAAGIAKSTLFQQNLYWIRLVNTDGQWDNPSTAQPLPILQNIAMNTVQVVQQESIRSEVPKKVTANGSTHYQLAKTPMFSEVVWVDETSEMTEFEVWKLEQTAAENGDLRFERDSRGNVVKVWYMWQPISSLTGQGQDARVYEIDHTQGVIQFGNGVQGKQPPTSVSKINVDYKATNGAGGNVPAGQIKRLRKTIPFVQGVSNPVPSVGGSDAETVSQVSKRAPGVVWHRGRAVTAADFEWLAREADPNVAKVKCLPPHTAPMQPGSITLCVYPRSGFGDPNLFAQMQEQVEDYLYQTSGLPAQSQIIQVVEPARIEVSVTAVLVTDRQVYVDQVEADALNALTSFLDPLTGNQQGSGWGIGEMIYSSQFYPLLKSVTGVIHIKNIEMNVTIVENGQSQVLKAQPSVNRPDGLVLSGAHHVQVEISDQS